MQISQVHSDHVVEGRFVFAAHLPQAGKTGNSVYAFALPRLVICKFIRDAGSRSDQAHFAGKHIKNLRQFIQPACAQKPAKRGQTRIALGVQLGHRTICPDQLYEIALVSLSLGTYLHGPEFPDHKLTAAQANAPLPVENRPRRGESRHQHQQKHQGEPQWERN